MMLQEEMYKPAIGQTPLLDAAPALHAMSCIKLSDLAMQSNTRILTALVTSVTGELLAGSRAQDEPASVSPIHNSWNVACADTYAARNTREMSCIVG